MGNESNSQKTIQAVPKNPFGYRDNELYAMHQRQLQLRKEQQLQQQQKNMNSSLIGSGVTNSAAGILLSGSQNASNSPATSTTATGEGSAGGAGNSAAGGDFSLLSPQEMSLDFQVESPHDTKTGILTAEDEGGGGGGGSSSAIGETKSLLTSKGLQPSFNDLENLFDDNLMGGCDDNSNDESVS